MASLRAITLPFQYSQGAFQPLGDLLYGEASMRAAASSMANSKPPRARHVFATASAFSAVNPKSGRFSQHARRRAGSHHAA